MTRPILKSSEMMETVKLQKIRFIFLLLWVNSSIYSGCDSTLIYTFPLVRTSAIITTTILLDAVKLGPPPSF